MFTPCELGWVIAPWEPWRGQSQFWIGSHSECDRLLG
jgi:hypothetical protein